jgi:hypothetical protein
LPESKLTNLKAGISIGERLHYVKGLFGGNADRFNETLEALNNLHSYSEATAYLEQHIVHPFGWLDELKRESVHDFLRLLHRRFGK